TLVPADPGYDRHLSDLADGWLAEAAQLVPADVTAHTHLVYAESFADGLLEAAERLGGELIVVGAARGGLLGRFTIGSVASSLLHASHVPVALAPEGARNGALGEGISRVTCAVGTRAGAEALLQAGIQVADSNSVPLRLVSLVGVDLPGGHDDPTILAKGAEHAEAAAARARAALDANAEVTTVVASGTSIEDAVTRLDWDPNEVVLVGSSRLAQPHRLFLGSTAAKMLHELPVPMIVVPREVAATQAGE
ncbi:universal stress protein, partial [Kitasatospora indigofera]|uniref:universal stress protein n=1 Tax=Kitasatospora indigofera TaxID=67307 RepID=UPI003691A95A